FSIKIKSQLLNLITYGIALLLLLTAIVYYDKAYTSITFSLLAAFLILQRVLFKNYIEHNFYPAFLISILPFMLVNGVLTANPVVIYNNAENLGIRITTIPFEDFWYGMLLILMNVVIVELLRKRSLTKSELNEQNF
ncbi:MAG: lycopene cyclase domain-containing protein, partial [Bacteroidia bacterium]